ncbi:MAG: ChaN family lipoprotein [Rhodospirillales bacterium]|nr:ChaN family lipoprotein [Alphaproteobacteria bacterium]MBL6929112.1 ChaN family lipoprotein [Rhodospirillales bacterium]
MAARPVVLLGETHTSPDDHRWQMQVLAAVHSRAPNLSIGFEAFPRRVQPVLDRWVAGELSKRRFLAEVGWGDVWGFEPALYMPLFDFARMNSVPMIALNVDRALVSRVGREGWDAVPRDEREGVGDPAPPNPAYVVSLGRVYAQHKKKEDAPPQDEDPAFARFVQAQLTWDRAMAEAIAAARKKHAAGPLVGIIGRGHLEYGYGVPHQLSDLGIDDAAVAVTWTDERDCAEMLADGGVPVADVVFGVRAEADEEVKPRGPLLGVLISEAEGGVRIDGVSENSVATASGLEKGDVVTHAAGRAVEKSADFAAIIRSQPYGTWLPLQVLRAGKRIEVVAKFPARPHPPMKGPSPHKRKSTKKAE